MSTEQKPLPVAARVEHHKGEDNLAEAQHAIDCMETEIARLTTERRLQDETVTILRAALADARTERDAALADAQRYRLLRRGQHWSVVDRIGDVLRGDELDTSIDAELPLAATAEPRA